jgi:hypothetical protein
MYNKQFQILGLEDNATFQEVKLAFRELAKTYHPDINNSPDAQVKFIEISKAYECIIDNWKEISQTKHEDSTNEEDDDYLTIIQQAKNQVRENARRQAQKKYEKKIKDNEAYLQSGLSDIFLAISIFIRIVIVPLAIFLILLPIYLASIDHLVMLFMAVLSWPFAGVIIWYILSNKEKYLMPGKFYYTFKKIKKLYFTTNESSSTECYYCNGLKANSRPYKIYLLKIKKIRLSNSGPLQHSASYDNVSAKVYVPRSQKAFIVHSLNTVLKVSLILGFLFFFPQKSYVWRFISGLFASALISSLFLKIYKTKSNVSYIVNFAIVIKVAVWIGSIIYFTDFHRGYMNALTSDYTRAVIVFLLFLDPFIEEIALSLNKKRFSKPLFNQSPEVMEYFNKGYQLYLPFPIWSALTPFLKWILG